MGTITQCRNNNVDVLYRFLLKSTEEMCGSSD